ncbi:Acetyltransferase (isoleucine patch superfamily) [hydrothermal vent metagenome]|uniref:Acetyltransferase (Isoleucine patch superfamily) n=1 Tax=hydrothermal vent metagenome TaxID=652676 RepID=A0A1W1C3C8_9ZZZZ
MENSIFMVGTGGMAIDLTEFIEDNNNISTSNILNIKGYFDVDDKEYNIYTYEAPFLGNEREFNFDEKSNIIIAIANGNIRAKVFNFFKSKKSFFPSFIHHSCFVSKRSKISEGAILCPFVTITSNASIGLCFHAHIYSYVAHDCVIGDFVTFAPAVKCNGNVEIRDNVYVGTGAIIKQGKHNKPLIIGKNAVIEAGAYVTKSVPEGQTVFGNPAIEFTKNNFKRRS